MPRLRWILLVLLLAGPEVQADDTDVVCFFPRKINFNEINKMCKKDDLIRTKSNMAELVCDWDRQIFKYTEDDEEWVTCVYHGKSRQLKQINN